MATPNIITIRNMTISPLDASEEGLWTAPWNICLNGEKAGEMAFSGRAANGEVTLGYDIEGLDAERAACAIEALSYWAFRHHEVERVLADAPDGAILEKAGFERRGAGYVRRKLIRSTLCYLEKDGSYLMLYRNKKKEDPCAGKWVGIGGKFEPGESGDECLEREVLEETGLKITGYEFRGIIRFISDLWDDEDMYLYTGSSWEGEDTFASGTFECDEGELVWIPKDKILSLNLWEGDKYFLEPMIMGESNIYMTCRYEGDRLVECIK